MTPFEFIEKLYRF